MDLCGLRSSCRFISAPCQHQGSSQYPAGASFQVRTGVILLSDEAGCWC